jgi:hypothetical protein
MWAARATDRQSVRRYGSALGCDHSWWTQTNRDGSIDDGLGPIAAPLRAKYSRRTVSHRLMYSRTVHRHAGSQGGNLYKNVALTAVIAPLSFLLCATALPQNATDAQSCEDSELYRNIRTTQPRPDGPLRQDNVTDEEVREIQRAALEVYPDSIVSISGVTDGCDCEDGPSCTAQVWLALNREYRTRSLVLSKIDGHWKLGAVQNWQLQYDAHQTSFPGFGRGPKQLQWLQANQRLLDSFPTCPTPSANWMLVRSDKNVLTCADMSSIKVSEFIRRVNFKHVNPPPISTPGYPWVRYWISRIAFDCRDSRQQIVEMDSYYSDGRVTKESSGKDPVLWDPIRHDTVSAKDLDLVCGWRAK